MQVSIEAKEQPPRCSSGVIYHYFEKGLSLALTNQAKVDRASGPKGFTHFQVPNPEITRTHCHDRIFVLFCFVLF